MQAPSTGRPCRSRTVPSKRQLSPFPSRQMSAPIGRIGAPSTWNGPKTVLGVGIRWTPVVDRVDEHGDTEDVGQQDELLPLLRADLTGPRQEVDRDLPFGLGQ